MILSSVKRCVTSLPGSRRFDSTVDSSIGVVYVSTSPVVSVMLCAHSRSRCRSTFVLCTPTFAIVPPAPTTPSQIANVAGTRHALQLAEAIHAEHFHQVSSIAAAGLYRGTFTEDMFDEATDVDNNPYYATKHESERLVREQSAVPWRIYRPGVVVGSSETGEID